MTFNQSDYLYSLEPVEMPFENSIFQSRHQPVLEKQQRIHHPDLNNIASRCSSSYFDTSNRGGGHQQLGLNSQYQIGLAQDHNEQTYSLNLGTAFSSHYRGDPLELNDNFGRNSLIKGKSISQIISPPNQRKLSRLKQKNSKIGHGNRLDFSDSNELANKKLPYWLGIMEQEFVADHYTNKQHINFSIDNRQ